MSPHIRKRGREVMPTTKHEPAQCALFDEKPRTGIQESSQVRILPLPRRREKMKENDQAITIDPGKISLSIAESAVACGLCERTISNAIRSGELPAARIGTRILVLRSTLISWIESCTDTTGAKVRPDLSEGLGKRNRARWAAYRAQKEKSKV